MTIKAKSFEIAREANGTMTVTLTIPDAPFTVAGVPVYEYRFTHEAATFATLGFCAAVIAATPCVPGPMRDWLRTMSAAWSRRGEQERFAV